MSYYSQFSAWVLAARDRAVAYIKNESIVGVDNMEEKGVRPKDLELERLLTGDAAELLLQLPNLGPGKPSTNWRERVINLVILRATLKNANVRGQSVVTFQADDITVERASELCRVEDIWLPEVHYFEPLKKDDRHDVVTHLQVDGKTVSFGTSMRSFCHNDAKAYVDYLTHDIRIPFSHWCPLSDDRFSDDENAPHAAWRMFNSLGSLEIVFPTGVAMIWKDEFDFISVESNRLTVYFKVGDRFAIIRFPDRLMPFLRFIGYQYSGCVHAIPRFRGRYTVIMLDGRKFEPLEESADDGWKKGPILVNRLNFPIFVGSDSKHLHQILPHSGYELKRLVTFGSQLCVITPHINGKYNEHDARWFSLQRNYVAALDDSNALPTVLNGIITEYTDAGRDIDAPNFGEIIECRDRQMRDKDEADESWWAAFYANCTPYTGAPPATDRPF